SLRPDRQGGDRPHSQHNHEGRLIMPSGHPGIYTSLTDMTAAAGWQDPADAGRTAFSREEVTV
ncbi:MAG: hypothetical protein ACK4P8_09535, partial [Tabrizicola sp.]